MRETEAPVEIFPREGAKALPKHSYILHISLCVGLLYIVHCYVLCVLEAGILGLHILNFCMQIEKKHNIMKEDKTVRLTCIIHIVCYILV